MEKPTIFKPFLLAALLIVGIATFTACSKDEEPSNSMSFNGETYPMEYAALFDEGIYYKLVIANVPITKDYRDAEGKHIDFDIKFSDKQSGVLAGNYVLSNDYLNKAIHLVEYTEKSGSVSLSHEADDAKLTIVCVGREFCCKYTINIIGVTLTGHYHGDIYEIKD